MTVQRVKLQSFSAKIILLCGTIALLGAGAMAWMNAARTLHQSRIATEMQIHDDTRYVLSSLQQGFHTLREATEVMSLLPEASELSLAVAEHGMFDAEAVMLREQITDAFSRVMAERPDFTQMRIILLDEAGSEIARVNQSEGILETVPTSGLQSKANEPYFITGRSLSAGEVAFTPVSLNREFGRITPDRTPTIRSITPITDPQTDTPIALLVINADYESLLTNTLQGTRTSFPTLVFDSQGNVFERHPEKGANRFFLQSDVPPDLQAILSRLEASPVDQLVRVDDTFHHVSLGNLPAQNVGLQISILQSVSAEQFYALFMESFLSNLLATAIILGITMIIGTIAALKLTAPLRSATATMKAFKIGDESTLPALPYERNDEIGDLAASFRQVLRALETERIQKHEFFEHGVDGFIVINVRGEIQVANAACETLFGYAVEELIGQNITKLVPEEIKDQHQGYIDNVLHGGKARVIGIGRDVEAVRKDGSKIPIGLSISKFTQNGEIFFCGSMRDISERTKMDRMKDEFVSTVNHELRTPLTSIFGSLDLLRQLAKDQMDEKCNRLINIAHQSCGRLTSLVNDILDLEKIAAGKMDYHLEPVSIQTLVEEIADNQKSLAHVFRTFFKVRHNGADSLVNVDKNRLTQALVNLYSNAAKFSPEGTSVLVTTEVLSNGFVRVSVTDFGPGIPEDFQSRIFEKFAQADGSSQRKVQGTGLGLSITKSIVEAFGGSISFHTSQGHGTTFYFDLPIKEAITTTTKVA